MLRLIVIKGNDPENKVIKYVTIQPHPNQLDNIDFDVIGTSDY